MGLKTSILLALVGYFSLKAVATCTSYGIDYSNGGSYNINSSSDENFTFTSVFQGCDEESIEPVVVDPSGQQYIYSEIDTVPQWKEVISTCPISYSSMMSGTWKIVLLGVKIAVQRVITLTTGTPSTFVVTATPTVVIGIRSTPEATTTYETIATQTQTLILAPETITAPCSGLTQTVTIIPKASTSISTSTIVRTATDKQVTSYSYTTITKTAYCHYITTKSYTLLPSPTVCIVRGGSPPWKYIQVDSETQTIGLIDQASEKSKLKTNAIAATTITVTETTFTVTSTSVTTIPPETKTENVVETVTATITPAPSTICDGGAPDTAITITRPFVTITQTNTAYSTSHITGTVLVGKTMYTVTTNRASSTACWRDWGWMGADP